MNKTNAEQVMIQALLLEMAADLESESNWGRDISEVIALSGGKEIE